MEWIDEMKIAMKLIKDACGKNNSTGDCSNCPFEKYCDLIVSCGDYIPRMWKIED